MSLPKKRDYRQRAHSNPIADHSFSYPAAPLAINWSNYYSDTKSYLPPEFVDIGCGYGGLLLALSKLYPKSRAVGFEIRVKVSDYVQERIKALRKDNQNMYGNIACIRSNCMKYLPNYFSKAQLSKMFFLFPDPHFKKSKHKWRVISPSLLAEYAYFLKIGGLVYTVTDVSELHEWMVEHLASHPLFIRVSDIEMSDDPVVPLLFDSSEEGIKVSRNAGEKFLAIFRRVEDPNGKAEVSSNG